jgi:ABC-type branched-subunit amino acid transport system ATPase component/ABC-type branched-subunit amino acid transport system permease subunit
LAANLRTQLTENAITKWIAGIALIIIILASSATILPKGLPLGVIFLGAVDGALYALTALGLVLIYRSQRIVNFAQAEIGALSVSVAVVMVSVYHVEYFLAAALGIIAALVTGAIIHFIVEWRFSKAPRMLLTVATIGLAQLIGSLEVGIPFLANKGNSSILLVPFKTPLKFSFTISDITFGGDHIVAIGAVVLCVAGLWYFLERTETGIAIRGAADSRDRARLLGIPVSKLSLITWMAAAALSAVGALASAPSDMGNPPDLTAIAGPVALLPPLAAAVVGRMENLSVTAIAAIMIGIFQQGVFWSYPKSSSVDVGFFVVIMIALLIIPPKRARSESGGSQSSYVNIRETRPIPDVLKRLPEVILVNRIIPFIIAAFAVLIPVFMGQRVVLPFAYIGIFGLFTVSLVLLSGWGGQISLGQSGFAGVGAAAVGYLLVNHHADFFFTLAVSAVIGACFAVAIGIPALRIPGLFLSVATLAFAVPADTFLLNATQFPALNPSSVPPPRLFGNFNMGNVSVFYIVVSILLILLCIGVYNLRKSRVGRNLIAVRDNDPGASVYGVSGVKLKLWAFALAGAMAGVAGGMLIILQQGSGFSGFDPELSFTVFIGVVIGGLGSLSGAVLGAVFIGLLEYYVSGTIGLVIQGIILLAILMFIPEGIGGIMAAIRQRFLEAVSARRNIEIPSILYTETEQKIADGTHSENEVVGDTILSAHHTDVYYGHVQVIFGVSVGVKAGEVLALLGTNGAGKSTMLNTFAGILNPKKGYIKFLGMDASQFKAEDRVARGLVMVPGGRGVFPSLSVRENLRLACWTQRKDPAYIKQALVAVKKLFPALESRMDTEARMLSGGEQQMLTIAQAILCRPKVLLIDELSLGLAPVIVSQLLDVVAQMRDQGLTIVLVEQSLNVASAVADRAVFIERGQIRFNGPLGELSANPELARAVFLGSGDYKGSIAPSEVTYDVIVPSFEVYSVSKRFGGVMAVEGVSLRLYPGEIHGIIGANGAGKTTLFDICSGFIKPDSGSVLLDGRNITSLSAYKRSELGLGRVFQHATLFPTLTVFETIALAFERFIYPKEPFAFLFKIPKANSEEKYIRQQTLNLIKELNLTRWQDAFISELSTGTRRVVELACVLAHRPNVILMDEPSSGLAQRESESLGELLVEINRKTGATLVIIEHDVPLIASIANSMTCLHLGQVLSVGTPQEVLSNPDVIQAFLGTDIEAIQRSSGLIPSH